MQEDNDVNVSESWREECRQEFNVLDNRKRGRVLA